MSEVPDGLYYTKEHEWIRVEGDEVVIGITDHAQDALTDIVYIELPEDGELIFDPEEEVENDNDDDYTAAQKKPPNRCKKIQKRSEIIRKRKEKCCKNGPTMLNLKPVRKQTISCE